MPNKILTIVALISVVWVLQVMGQTEWSGLVCFDAYICCNRGNCTKNQYFDEAFQKCLQCGPNRYLHAEGHACLSCQYCSEAKTRIEECSNDEDVCEEGFFAQVGASVHDELTCVPCTKCATDEYEVRRCGNSVNTKCEKMTQTSEPSTTAARYKRYSDKTTPPTTTRAVARQGQSGATTCKAFCFFFWLIGCIFVILLLLFFNFVELGKANL